jgi:Cu(I)/Ag(I) efflux system membrane protein CusA/SilA
MPHCPESIRIPNILWEAGIGSDVMKLIAAPIVGGMITSAIHVLILVPVSCLMMDEGARIAERTSAAADFRKSI